MVKPVRLTAHLHAKLVFLRQHGFYVDEEAVVTTVKHPDHVSRGRMGRWVAQHRISERHVLRVIYEETPHERLVITCYPARRSRYEPTHEL